MTLEQIAERLRKVLSDHQWIADGEAGRDIDALALEIEIAARKQRETGRP